jgi:arylsulfatase A-like enzyme
VAGNRRGHPKSYFSPYENKDLVDGPEREYLPQRLVDEAINFVSGESDPFFLYLPFFSVHTPVQARPEDIEKFRVKTPDGGHRNPAYAAMIYGVDQQIGRLLRFLNEKQLGENTVIVLCSDNGGHAGFTSQDPLRGAKGMMYEGGIRVPLMIKVPSPVDNLEQGTESKTPVTLMDLLPTLVQICGLETLDDVDGHSIVNGQTKEDRPLYWSFPVYLESNRGAATPFRTTPVEALRFGNWKLLHFFEDDVYELYDLQTDLGESKNLIDKNRKQFETMKTMLDSIRTARNWPPYLPINTEYDSTAVFGVLGLE